MYLLEWLLLAKETDLGGFSPFISTPGLPGDGWGLLGGILRCPAQFLASYILNKELKNSHSPNLKKKKHSKNRTKDKKADE